MTMAGFTIQPDDLHTTGQALDQAGGDLHTQWQQLKAQTLAIRYGSTDAISPLIQMTMLGAVAIADSCFGSSRDAMSGHAQALRSAAQHYTDAEASSSALFSAQ
jgi:hypothetical protein